MNDELAKMGAYTKLDQKPVTAWLGLRNSAAHGRYDEYRAEQAGAMLAGVRDFASRAGDATQQGAAAGDAAAERQPVLRF